MKRSIIAAVPLFCAAVDSS